MSYAKEIKKGREEREGALGTISEKKEKKKAAKKEEKKKKKKKELTSRER